MFLAVIFVFIYFLIKKKTFKSIHLKLFLKYFIGGVIIAFHWIAFFTAIKVSNVSVALVSMSTGALFTSLIEPIFFKRRLDFIEFIFGLIVISGLYIIFNVESDYTLRNYLCFNCSIFICFIYSIKRFVCKTNMMLK